jgi:hypothetical protein
MRNKLNNLKDLLNLEALEAELTLTLAYFERMDYNVSQREIDEAMRLTKAVKALGSTKKW